MTFIKTFIKTLFILGVFDLLWIGFLSGNLYPEAIKNIQHSPLSIKIIPAVLAYLLMAFAVTVLVNENVVIKGNIYSSLKWGAFLGLVVYGIFNCTNCAIFNNWSYKVGITDTMWGTFLFTLTMVIINKWR
jgi:uncharacterized membrane protein